MDTSATSQLPRTSASPNTDDILQRSRRSRSIIDPTLPLCPSCQTLDLDADFDESFKYFERVKDDLDLPSRVMYEASDKRHYYNDAILVHQFGSRLSGLSQCPLCRFFRSLRIQPDLHECHKLLAFRSSDSWLFKDDRLRETQSGTQPLNQYVDAIFMAVVPDIESVPSSGHDVSWLDYEIPTVGAIFRQRAKQVDGAEKVNLLGARELDVKFDLNLLRLWLDTCRHEHGDACKPLGSREDIVQGFRLINCTESSPGVEEKPWGTTYAALSYVWGSTPTDLEDWPKTVLDAIELTRQLGLTYLWVDRLCIDRSDPAKTHYLISRMKNIYQDAEFTIVAAAGSGASHGLPGVGSTLRTPQPKYYLDSGSLLLSILRDPRRDILESQYWTRGWTYQEGVLSNRHIVFTEFQAYWECRCMAAQESADMTLFHMPETHKAESNFVMADFMLTGIFKGGAYSGGSIAHRDDLVISDDEVYRLDYGFPINQDLTVGAQLRGLNEHIREFSKRRLTHDTDALLAFQGVIGIYEKTRELYLFHGIPMWTGKIAGNANSAHITFALSVSSWYHRASPNHSMFVSEQCARRTHLPSWTWAGWNGTVTWRSPPNLEHCSYMSDLIKATTPNLVWAANIHLSRPIRPFPMRLQELQSVAQLTEETFTLIEIRDPFVLCSYEREEDTKRQFGWRKGVGRPGREQATTHRETWDEKWYRIGGRLSVVGMSIAITEEQWTDKHKSGELVSVLIFAGRYHISEHGTARFLTLQRVQSTPERWERVGTLYLILPFLADCKDNLELFRKIPAELQERRIIIIQ